MPAHPKIPDPTNPRWTVQAPALGGDRWMVAWVQPDAPTAYYGHYATQAIAIKTARALNRKLVEKGVIE